MAETLTWIIVLEEDDPSAFGWAEETEVHVFYDDVADDLVVKRYERDGTLIGTVTDGPILSLSGQTGVADCYARDQNYAFCDTNDLVEFELSGTSLLNFPYVEKRTTADSPTCTGVVCDLVITNVVVAQPFTIIQANKINGVTYSIDGEIYQASAVFQNLSPGNYRAYVRETNGCKAERTFVVPGEVQYDEIIECKFDFRNVEARLAISEVYLGEGSPPNTPETVKLSNAISLNYPNQSFNSIYDYNIRPSYLEVSLLSETASKFQSLYTSQPKKIRAIYYHDDVEVWRGYMTPSVFSEPYRDAPYQTQITFVDGLKMLDRIKVKDVDLEGFTNLSNILATFLRLTDLDLPIHEAIDVYGVGMDSNAPMLRQAYLDFNTFERDDDLNVYDAIEWILYPFGAELVQQDGAWWIVRKERRSTTSFDYYIYDQYGIYTNTTGTYIPTNNYNSPDVTNRVTNKNGYPTLDIMPAFGKIEFQNNLDLKESLLANYDFERAVFNLDGTFNRFNNWTFVQNGTANYPIRVKGIEGWSAGTQIVPSVIISSLQPRDSYYRAFTKRIRWKDGDKFRFRMKFSYDRLDAAIPFLIIPVEIKIGSDYAYENGTWSTTVNTLRFYPAPAEGSGEIKIELPLPSGVNLQTEETLDVKVYNYASNWPEVSQGTALETITTTDKKIGYKIDDNNSNVTIDYYELVTGNNGDVTPNDYNVSTNNKSWSLVKRLPYDPILTPNKDIVHNSQFVIDEVEIDYLPEGFEPIEEQVYDIFIDVTNPEVYTVEMNVGDLPIDNSSDASFIAQRELTPNDIYNYNSQFTNLSGIYYPRWGRKGVTESDRLQFLLNNTVVAQHRTQTRRLSGTFTTQEESWSSGIILKPLDSIYNSFDQKYYLVEGFTAADKDHYYELELVESKNGNSIGVYSEHTVSEHTNEEHS